MVFERQDFIARLAALTPAPRCHLTRFHGVLAPAAAWRSFIVPRPERNNENPAENTVPCAWDAAELSSNPERVEAAPASPERNYRWAELMKRVFLVDVLKCENCGGPVKMIAAVDLPEVIGKILRSVGLISRAPPSDMPPHRFRH